MTKKKQKLSPLVSLAEMVKKTKTFIFGNLGHLDYFFENE